MLRDLHIRDFAIIDELELSFDREFNVITGETGAGKSLLMQALGLLVGGRSSGELVRYGAEEAAIEALFMLEDEQAIQLMAENGLADGQEMIIRRIISQSGRGRIYINGTLSGLTFLRQLGEGLIHIYGQHEQQTLLRQEVAAQLLDGFAGLAAQVAEMGKRFRTLRQVWTHRKTLQEGKAATEARQDLLRYQLEDIARAKLCPGEEEELRQQRTILLNAEKLFQGVTIGEEALYAGEEAVVDRLGRLLTKLRELSRIDGSLQEVTTLLEDGLAQIEEGALRLKKYGDRIVPNPERLEEIDSRLALISRLKNKYGGTVEAVLAFKEAADRELQQLTGGEETLAALEKELAQAGEEAWQWAEKLSRARQEAAQELEQRMKKELLSLGMKGATFAVRFADTAGPALVGAHGRAPVHEGTTPAEQEPPNHPLSRGWKKLTEQGYDRPEFYLSANPGEPLLPLAQVASGGELSRLMLALKALSAAEGDVPTLIFDEVDAGIGGAVAEVVGRRLKALGQKRQVLCITHLPQIAALADHHYTVAKGMVRGRTISSARRLSSAEQLEELARMVGGVEITTEAKRHAREMLEGAKRSVQCQPRKD
jgi:DNA repair protein RecN (Recombination protein N)